MMAEERATQTETINQASIEALQSRLETIEKKLDKCNEDLRGTAAFFFFVVLIHACGISLGLSLVIGMVLTIAYVVYLDSRTLRRSRKNRK